MKEHIVNDLWTFPIPSDGVLYVRKDNGVTIGLTGSIVDDSRKGVTKNVRLTNATLGKSESEALYSTHSAFMGRK